MRLAAHDHRLADWETLLDELTPRQVTVLQAFQQLEGWGEQRQDTRAAIVATVTASAMGAKVDPQKVLEAMSPAHRPKPREMTPDQVAAGIRRLRTD